MDDTRESRSHGRTRKAARSGNDNLSYRAYSTKGISGKRWVAPKGILQHIILERH